MSGVNVAKQKARLNRATLLRTRRETESNIEGWEREKKKKCNNSKHLEDERDQEQHGPVTMRVLDRMRHTAQIAD